MDSYNPGNNVILPNLSFSTSIVRGAFIRYALNRKTDSTEVSEEGSIQIVYNASNPTSSKWEVTRDSIGDASITFTVTDVGQVQFSTTTISGANHAGKIFYTAQAMLQNQ